jgi:hypothetical protein
MRRLAVALLLACSPSTAQVPDGWYIVSSAQWVGDFQPRAPGGLFLVHPRSSAPPIPVQGLGTELTGSGTPFLSGANAVAIRPDDRTLYVGEAGRAPATIELHEITLQGANATTVRKTAVGVPDPLEFYGGISQIAVLANGDAVFSVNGLANGPPLFGWPLGHFDRATDAVRPLTYTRSNGGIVISPHAESLVIDEPRGVVYAVVTPLFGFSGQLLEIPFTGGDARFLTVLAGATGMARNGAGNIVSAKQYDVIEIDPQSGAWTRIATMPTGITGLSVEAATDRPVFLVDTPLQAEVHRVTAAGATERVTSGITGSATGIAVAHDPATYGTATPGVSTFHWQVAPNPGGLPFAGNAQFGLRVTASGGDASGLVLFGAAPLSLRLGFELLVQPLFSLPLPRSGALALPLAPSLPVGASVYVQSLHLDPGVVGGIASSEGGRITVL